MVRITDNDIRSTAQNAFVATTGMTGAYLHLAGNYVETLAAGAGLYAIIVRGAAGVYFHSGEYKNTGSGDAVRLQADAAANNIGEAMFGPENIIRQGTFVFSGVTMWKGILSGTGSPENVYAADRGTMYLRTDGGIGTTLYIKESLNGLNTGWLAK